VSGSGFNTILGMLAPLRRRRVPVLHQLSMLDCGATCLAMILNYHGRRTSVAECRDACGIGRDGVTAQTIAAAARAYGLRVKAYSVEPGNLQDLQLPVIAHWSFNHFVIVERWSRKTVDIVDPAVGRRTLSADEFGADFTGVVLALVPAPHFEPSGQRIRSSSWSCLRSMLRLRETRGLLAQVLGASLVLQILGLALPWLTRFTIDSILPHQPEGLMKLLGAGIALVALSQLVASYLRAALLLYLEAKLDSNLMLSFFEHVLSLPFAFFLQRPSGDLLMRLAANSAIRDLLTGRAIAAILDGSFVLAYLGVLSFLTPGFGTAVLALGALQVALMLATTGRMRALANQDLAAAAESQSYLVEALSGIGTLKAAGAEDHALEHWSNLFYRHMNLTVRRGHLNAALDSALMTARVLSPLILLWLGVERVLDGSLTVGSMLALNALAASFLTPLSSLIATGQQLQLVRAHLDRVADVLHAEPEQDRAKVRRSPPLKGSIDLRSVSFRYTPNSPWVLRDVSLTIEPGQKVALVGATGSGKSTLAKLLLSLYTPTQGEILFDGTRLDSLDYRTVRRQLGVVLQEASLYSGSIRQNIALNDPGLSLDEVMRAARLSHIHDEILDMPMAYETPLAEGGAGLSGGQRQRIAIARALAHRPAVLLLDEATSHLDVMTEELVDRSLQCLSCTRIMIAHRLSTVRNADLILVLARGEIVERGSHEELLALKGHYAAMVFGHAGVATTMCG
jgi:HlyB family type I secretion system ABC transporter